MVLCKYFQQGTCRFGQYCKFEHSFGNRSKTFNDEKNIALLVAEEVLLAERGGQWLLSCYGPFKERKCIPGMDDLSPEEVRWEMYQAQKNGTTDQINAQFQQMCEAMKVKRNALKSPTPAIVQLLEEVQNSGSENAAFNDNSKLNKGNFAYGAPQLGVSSTNQTSSVFGQKTFGAPNNPFGTSAFNSTQATSSIFGRATTNSTTSVFGAKPSFGNAPVFGGTSPTGSSIFGGANKTAAAPFGTVQNAPTFGGLASQGTSIFGGTTATQSTFGQPAAFGVNTAQPANAFLKPQTASQTSVFGGGAATTTSNVFGGAATAATAAVAAAAAPVVTNSVFGVAATPATSSAPTGAGIFGGQATTGTAAFGGAPVFGGPAGFAQSGAAAGSVFGGQSVFGGATAVVSSSNNVFGGANTVTSSFGVLAQGPVTNAFGGATANTGNAFEAAPNAAPFGAPISTAAGPFGTINAAANPVFATSASSAPGPFGGAMTSTFGFATPATTTTNVFGTTTATSAVQPAFGASTFGATAPTGNSVFATSTTAVAAGSNPFMAKTQQPNSASPFSIAAPTQASPFGNFAKSSNACGLSVTVTIDETAYSAEDSLTDDEKAAYRMVQFLEGQIPLKPPTKELR